jgi:hypothetical protein
MERYIIIVVNVINTPLENDIIWKEAWDWMGWLWSSGRRWLGIALELDKT